jgi:hypothetical protein
MNEKHKIILSILLANKEAITTEEIYNSLEPAEKGVITSKIELQKLVSDIKRNKGYICNGNPDNVGGKPLLTWTLTDNGHAVISKEIAKPIIESNAVPIIESQAVPVEKIKEDVEVIEISDPIAYITAQHEAIIDIVKQLQQESGKMPKIAYKQEKLKVLSHFIEFSKVMNADFAQVLSDICTDLSKLESV